MRRAAALATVTAAACAAGAALDHWLITAGRPPAAEAGDSRPNEAPDLTPEGNDRRVVAALGRLEPEGEVVEVGAPPGDRVGRVLVVEGQSVKRGEPLVELESREERLATRQHAAAQLAEAQARLAAETARGRALVREAEIAVEQLRELSPLDLAAQQARVRLQQSQLDELKTHLSRLGKLKANLTVTEQEYEHQSALVRQSEEELAVATAQLNKLRATERFDTIRRGASLETAKASLEVARTTNPVASLEEALRLADAQAKLTEIRAPRDGRVLRIRTRPGEVTGAKPILLLGDTEHLQAVAEVYHSDARLVRIGQSAVVTSPALPGPISGRVVQVGSMVHKNDVLNIDPTADVDSRVVEFRLRLAPDETASRLIHLQVNVLIHVEEPSPAPDADGAGL